MDHAIRREISAIAADTRSGATTILGRALDVMARVAADRAELDQVADELCRAQPAMAGLRNVAAEVRAAADPATALDRFRRRVARAPSAIARYASELLLMRTAAGPCRLVTCSASAAVEAVIIAVAGRADAVAICSEGRPQLEGRDLAARLAAAGCRVELYTDAGLGSALDGADALLVGADAVGPSSFINKVGTGALSALASSIAVPVYVLAGREKVLSAADFASLRPNSGAPAEVWADPPGGVVVRNPYFETIALTSASCVITDGGIRNM